MTKELKELTFTLKFDEFADMAVAAKLLTSEPQSSNDLGSYEWVLQKLCFRGLARTDGHGYRRGHFWLQAAAQLDWPTEEDE